MASQYPRESTRASQILGIIETHPGQTRWWLMLKSGAGANCTEQALRNLLKHERVAFVEDKHGRKRYHVTAR